MKDRVLQVVRDFLFRTEPKGPLIVGFSGGADSTALVHLLQEAERFYPMDLRLVHIDHGWRDESYDEATLLQKEYSVHVERIEGVSGANLEEKFREKRLEILARLYKEWGAGALMLAHHADDQAETVLKRVLEGSSALHGLLPDRKLLGMRVLRPLLTVTKERLVRWLQERGIGFLEDPTNEDTHYLRARMRKEIIPFLEASFGKGIRKNLCKLGATNRCLLNNDFLS